MFFLGARSGGMATFAWKEFLTQWSQELLAYEDIRTDRRRLLPAGAVSAGWLGFAGATEAQIAQAEARLGIRLPPSYREFLAVSNGWSVLTWFIDHLWSTDEIDWLSVRRQDLIDGWLPLRDECPDEEYRAYTEEGVARGQCSDGRRGSSHGQETIRAGSTGGPAGRGQVLPHRP
jgi:hypothetical protein